jgi:hypothetical protein
MKSGKRESMVFFIAWQSGAAHKKIQSTKSKGMHEILHCMAKLSNF